MKFYYNVRRSKHQVCASLAAAALAGRNTALAVGKAVIITVIRFQLEASVL